MSRELTTPGGRGRMLRSPGDSRSQTQRGGGMGWREAPDHAESVLDAARRRLPRLLNHQNFSQRESEVWTFHPSAHALGMSDFHSATVTLETEYAGHVPICHAPGGGGPSSKISPRCETRSRGMGAGWP